ncbi:hypothetical protein OG913_33530 [Microbispora hainanensis]|uniref:Uncharacterized protein n=1 Tax=Microbispora hainanensis TaxID=568844 RepID=A0ABZ1SMM8_9ACTN|nr:hypothetical protein [Microbispora hainanensis]
MAEYVMVVSRATAAVAPVPPSSVPACPAALKISGSGVASPRPARANPATARIGVGATTTAVRPAAASAVPLRTRTRAGCRADNRSPTSRPAVWEAVKATRPSEATPSEAPRSSCRNTPLQVMTAPSQASTAAPSAPRSRTRRVQPARHPRRPAPSSVRAGRCSAENSSAGSPLPTTRTTAVTTAPRIR